MKRLNFDQLFRPDGPAQITAPPPPPSPVLALPPAPATEQMDSATRKGATR